MRRAVILGRVPFVRAVRTRRPTDPLAAGGEAASRLPPALLPVLDFASPPACPAAPSVWAAPTFGAAWQALFAELDATRGGGPGSAGRRRLLETTDLAALAKASSHAELDALLACLPPELRRAVVSHSAFDVDTVEEIYVHVGQPVELRSAAGTAMLGLATPDDVLAVARSVGHFADDGRACIPGTLHRVSCWQGRHGATLGVTMRVGRYLPGVASGLLPMARRGNLLVLSKPGAGKTTILRDLAAQLARDPEQPRVIVVDTSNEIGGDSNVPLPYLYRTRRLQVPRRAMQLHYMTQVIQNHSPDYVVVDEISTEEEAHAMVSMAQRGIRLIATAHGETLSKLLQNRALCQVTGGVAQAFLSNEERRMRAKVKKTILERPYQSSFASVVELTTRGAGLVYRDVEGAVDALLDDKDPSRDPKYVTPVELSVFGATQPIAVADDDGYTVGPAIARTAVGAAVAGAAAVAPRIEPPVAPTPPDRFTVEDDDDDDLDDLI